MKGKYINTQILLACLSKPVSVKKENSSATQENIQPAAEGKTKSIDSRKAA